MDAESRFCAAVSLSPVSPGSTAKASDGKSSRTQTSCSDAAGAFLLLGTRLAHSFIHSLAVVNICAHRSSKSISIP